MPRARKRFGQHFLSPEWARRVAAAAEPSADDVFLEIGPGTGVLTRPLAERARQVVAVEIDRDLAAGLEASRPLNVSIVVGDVLELDLDGLVREWAPANGLRVAGNLPYNISSPILFRLIAAHRATRLLRDATLMLQREVVERLVAEPGTREYGVLTVLVRLYASAKQVLQLPPGAFRPRPKVFSSVVHLAFGEPRVRLTDPDRFERLVKALFAHRRKTTLNGLKAVCPDPRSAPRVLEAAGIDPRRRPETLDLPELAALSELLGSARG